MKLNIHEEGLFVEELVFQVKPELINQYVELEYDIMASELQKLPGFKGWQIWESKTNIGEITSIYLWDSFESYKNINQDWLLEKKIAISECIGLDNCKFVKAGHIENKRHQLRSIM